MYRMQVYHWTGWGGWHRQDNSLTAPWKFIQAADDSVKPTRIQKYLHALGINTGYD